MGGIKELKKLKFRDVWSLAWWLISNWQAVEDVWDELEELVKRAKKSRKEARDGKA